MMKALKGLGAMLLALVIAAPLQAGDEPESVYDFSFTAIEGDELNLADYSGQPVLLVNTASFCGFTYQYDGLQTLWERYRDAGLVVLGVPSDDFNQEPGSDAEIKDFCEVNFGLDFPMTRKEMVKGPQAHPLYRWTADMLGAEGQPRWNFHKILFNRSGKPVAGFNSSVEPQSEPMIEAIEAALASS